MSLVQRGTVGILPAGALGVAFFDHLTKGGSEALDRVCFVARENSESSRALREAGKLRIASPGGLIELTRREIWRPPLLECAKEARIPEILLVCTQPDQLLGVISENVRLFQWLTARFTLEESAAQLPALVLCSNGIYFQRVRQFLIERLEEATLLGRLPDLWPDSMPRVVGQLLRGVTIQTGQREGSGPTAIYRPGARGRTRLAGGNLSVRTRCAEVLAELGGWFELGGDASPTRVEFDKALVNLTVNLLGQLSAIDEQGRFTPLRIEQILAGANGPEARELARQVIEVGRAVHAYRADEAVEPLWDQMMESCQQHLEHVPSSLQWIEMELRSGRLKPQLSPTERWLIEPLIRYAHAAGLEEAAHYFENLTWRVEARLALAIDAARKEKGEALKASP